VKEISQYKGETINDGIYYTTLEISYIIHTLRRNGVTVQRHKGRGAQGHKGVTAKRFSGGTA